jgi:hypothetical protein
MFGYKSWNIFPGKLLDNLELSDCNDTISGTCEKTQNVQECVDICEKHNCLYGYFINNLCVPLLSNDKSSSPYYRLVDKNKYPGMENANTFVFSSKYFEFPSEVPNVLFYADKFTAKLNNEKFLGLQEQDLTFSETGLPIQFMPPELSNKFIANYVMVNNGDRVVVNIPGTSYLLRKNTEKPTLSWETRATVINDNQNIFNIYCVRLGITGPNEPMNYNDTFFLTFQNSPVLYNLEDSTIFVGTDSVKNSFNNKLPMTFTFIPKMPVAYCSEGSCVKTTLDKTTMDGPFATINGNNVFRKLDCWNQCEQKSMNQDEEETEIDTGHRYLFFSLFFLMILSLGFFYFNRRRIR